MHALRISQLNGLSCQGNAPSPLFPLFHRFRYFRKKKNVYYRMKDGKGKKERRTGKYHAARKVYSRRTTPRCPPQLCNETAHMLYCVCVSHCSHGIVTGHHFNGAKRPCHVFPTAVLGVGLTLDSSTPLMVSPFTLRPSALATSPFPLASGPVTPLACICFERKRSTRL